MAFPLNCLRPDVMSWQGALTCLFTKYGQRKVCPTIGTSVSSVLSEKGRPFDMRQLQGYKVVLCERLKPLAKILIGLYQCDFRPSKSIIDQIFKLRQILEKTQKNKSTDTIFLSTIRQPSIRNRVFAAMSELGISAKLLMLCTVVWRNYCSSVKVGMDSFVSIDTVRGFRQGDPLPYDLFNFAMESVL